MSQRHRALDHFGKNVRKHRTDKGLSQEALAEKADLDSTYISGIERGVRNLNRPEPLFRKCGEIHRFQLACGPK